MVKKASNSRRRPCLKKRQEQKGSAPSILHELYGTQEEVTKAGSKRKGVTGEEEGYKNTRRKESRVIPNEGSPKLR